MNIGKQVITRSKLWFSEYRTFGEVRTRLVPLSNKIKVEYRRPGGK